MKRYFEIKSYTSGSETKFYTILEGGETLSETDKFFIRFKDNPDFKEDIEIIVKWIQKIGKEGALERFLRPEERAGAIPLETSNLRLYCFRVNDNILILGNGGQKTSQLVKDSPDAFPHFKIINDLAFILKWKLSKNDLKISGKQLLGNLTFFTKTQQTDERDI